MPGVVPWRLTWNVEPAVNVVTPAATESTPGSVPPGLTLPAHANWGTLPVPDKTAPLEIIRPPDRAPATANSPFPTRESGTEFAVPFRTIVPFPTWRKLDPAEPITLLKTSI